MGFGCRKPLAPNIDRNQPPETWIVAAPQDTLTVKDDTGVPVAPRLTNIPVKFHLYWAGSDPDGEVVGFYYAVVETLPVPPVGQTEVPSLPGPKPRDYHYTTRTDSTFLFDVSVLTTRPDRQHAFFIYAVDNKGKADPTPARIVFNAQDRFPPEPVMELGFLLSDSTTAGALTSGHVYRQLQDGSISVRDTIIFMNHSGNPDNSGLAPEDTVVSTSQSDTRLRFRWRGEPAIAGTYVAGYRYKLEEADFVSVDSSVHSVTYNTGVGADHVLPGTKVFTLRAVDQAGGSKEINRRFRINFDPDTWFSGPDPSQPIYDHVDPVDGRRYYDMGNGERQLPGFTNSLLSGDSVATLPAERPQRKTFYEIYDPDGSGPLGSRLYVRSENDTVHMNSWVILHNGGLDIDSPYNVHVNRDIFQPGLPEGKALDAGPPNGSPVGFHQQYLNVLYNGGLGVLSVGGQSGLYPVFNPGSVFHSSVMAGYGQMFQAGKVYAVARAEDGDLQLDQRLIYPFAIRQLADRVDAHEGTEDEEKLRSRILVFYVDKAPFLLPGSIPPPDPREPPYAFPSRQLQLNLLADDLDPYDPNHLPSGPGGPSQPPPVLRWFVTLQGTNAAGDTITFKPLLAAVFTPQIEVNLPSTLVGTRLILHVQLCDCGQCELHPGEGRCRDYFIPISVPPPVGSEASVSSRSRPGPGSSNAGQRSEEP